MNNPSLRATEAVPDGSDLEVIELVAKYIVG